MIQKKIHRACFAVMDGTFAGDGPGPRCMTPYVKIVLLASATRWRLMPWRPKLMGMDPLSIKLSAWRTTWAWAAATRATLNWWATWKAANEKLAFCRSLPKMTFASRMQHKIYWGPLKKPLEWSLKTVLAPWSYLASVAFSR